MSSQKAHLLRARWVRFGVLAAVMTAALGCTGLRHGASLAEYQGQVLRVTDGPGASRLAIESAYDVTVRRFVQQNGEPDYIEVMDGSSLQLMYVEDDRIILFQRPVLNPKSQATVTDGIPGPLASMFTRADQERLARARARRSPAALAPAQAP